MKIQNLIPLAWYAAKVFVLALVLLLTFKVLGPLPLSVNTKALDKDNTFYVSADSSVFIKPDTAVISLGVKISENTASQAQRKANETINRVTAELKKMGVKESDIKTTDYSIQPIYSNTGGSITGYSASLSIQIKEKDFERLNSILDKATGLGINQVQEVYFDVEDRDAAVDQARKAAIEKAKDKATKIAAQAGIKLGRIINVTEGLSNYPIYYDKMGGYGGGPDSASAVQPGQAEIKVSVTLNYETY